MYMLAFYDSGDSFPGQDGMVFQPELGNVDAFIGSSFDDCTRKGMTGRCFHKGEDAQHVASRTCLTDNVKMQHCKYPLSKSACFIKVDTLDSS